MLKQYSFLAIGIGIIFSCLQTGSAQTPQSGHLYGFKLKPHSSPPVYQICDEKGKATGPDLFDEFNPDYANFSTFALVKKKGSWGVVDTHGQVLVPFLYYRMEPFVTCKGERIEGKNQTMPLKAYSGRFLVNYDHGEEGVIDQNGESKLRLQGISSIRSRTDSSLIFLIKNYASEYALADTNGMIILPFTLYDDLLVGFDGPILVKANDQKFYILGKKPGPSFDNCLPGNTSILKKDNKWGKLPFHNEAGIPFENDTILCISKGIYGLKKQGKWEVISNQKGVKRLNALALDDIVTDDYTGETYFGRVGASWTEFDINTGRAIVTFNCDRIYTSSNVSYLCIEKENKQQLCQDRTGKIIMPAVYEKIDIDGMDNDGDKLVKVHNKGMEGVYDLRKKKEVIGCQYEMVDFSVFSDFPDATMIKVKTKGKYGVYDMRLCKEIIPCIYDDLKLDYYLDDPAHLFIPVKEHGRWTNYLMDIRFNPYERTTSVTHSLFAAKTEVTVKDWLGYMQLSETERGVDALSMNKLMPDTDLLNPKARIAFRYLRLEKTEKLGEVDLNPYPMARTSSRTLYPLANKKEYFDALEYPVTGITYEQALAFCDWLGRYVSDSKDWPIMVLRLPTPEEWEEISVAGLRKEELSAGVRDSLNEKGCMLYRYKTDKACTKYDEMIKMRGKESVWASDFFPNVAGVNNLFGNVAEMTSDKGVSKGGSYDHYASQAALHKSISYTTPQPWLGFRYVITFPFAP